MQYSLSSIIKQLSQVIMVQGYFRFYGSLNDFLTAERRQRWINHFWPAAASIKDLIEALGVPHPEVDLLLVNGEPLDFGYLVRDQDWISIYPANYFVSVDLSELTRVRPAALTEARFILDCHLGKLAGYLRMFGFDTRYRNDYHDEELAAVSTQESRILLTRDIGLLKRAIVSYGYWLRSTNPSQQLVEIFHRYHLVDQVMPFQRCLRCNGRLAQIDKAEIIDRLPAQTSAAFDQFHICQNCQQIYWQGSHYQQMLAFIARLFPQAGLEKYFP